MPDLSPLSADFANPGALDAFIYRPEGLVGAAPLVVVLHGCTQSAASYDEGAGWSRLADLAQAQGRGFMLVFAQQRRGNNPNLCFNWFARKDTARGKGEAASIAAMVGALVADGSADPMRVMITGLSAGGAMAAEMLASYPELFAAGAIIAGLAAGAAEGVPEALAAMSGRGGRRTVAKAKVLRSAALPPRVSVWHGDADKTVVAANGDAVAAQALAAHGLADAPDEVLAIGPHKRRVWRGADGAVLVEQLIVAGMGHGVPLSTGVSTGGPAGGSQDTDGFGIGRAGPHMLEAEIDSTVRIADFFGLVDMAKLPKVAPLVSPGAARAKRGTVAKRRSALPHPIDSRAGKAERTSAALAQQAGRSGPAGKSGGVQAVIENALRKAGLM